MSMEEHADFMLDNQSNLEEEAKINIIPNNIVANNMHL